MYGAGLLLPLGGPPLGPLLGFAGGGCTAAAYPTGVFPVLLDDNDAALGQVPGAPTCGEALVGATGSNGVAALETTAAVFAGDSAAADAVPPGNVYNFITERTQTCKATTADALNGDPQNLFTLVVEDVWGVVSSVVNHILIALFGTGNDTTSSQYDAPEAFCNASTDYEKRITVAVVLARAPGQTAAPKPVWLSTIVPNPSPLVGAPQAEYTECNSLGLFCA